MHRLPDILSGVRILLAPVFLFLFFQEDFIMNTIGMAVYIIAAVTDYYDGYFARKYQIDSNFGAFLDPLADKILTFSGFIVLPFIDTTQFPWWAIIIIIIRDTFITILRVYLKHKKVNMQTRYSAKIKTTIQMVFLYLGLLIGLFQGVDFIAANWVEWLLNTNIMFYLMIFVTGVTAYSGIEYLLVNKKYLIPSK
jgi:CDP-diacylglycerol--glycerol-3-phosphate 3-phosphatidyltransferase